MTFRSKLLFLALVIAAFCALALLLGRTATSESTTAGDVRSTPRIERAGEVHPTSTVPNPIVATPQAEAMNQGPPLAPISDPLATRFANLERRSLQGDVSAALQLHIDLQNCARQEWREKQVAELLKQPPTASEGERRDRLKMAEVFMSQLEASATTCAGVTPEQLASRFTHLERAAFAGSEQAQLLFRSEGSSAALATNNTLIDPAELSRFQRQAARFTQAAARKCNGMAILLLAGDYDDGRFVDPDPTLALAMRLVLARTMAQPPDFQARPEPYPQGVAPPQRAQAQVHADRFYAQYCKGKKG